MQAFQKTKIKTICPVYAGQQKQQIAKLKKIPSETIGQMVYTETNEYNITYHLVKFNIDNILYWSKLSNSTFEMIESQ